MPFGFGSALVGSAPVGNGPALTAVDTATHTLYVGNGFNLAGNPTGENTVSVIDLRHCHADDVSRCKGPWPKITVAQPSGIAIDERTHTVYVSNFGDGVNDGTVSVFDGATCNAQNTSGCGQTPATVPVGIGPVGLFADPANHTVYVPNALQQESSMLDSATCNATHLGGCPTSPPPTVTVPGNPDSGAVDRSAHTVYMTEYGAFNGWSVFDANTCNATVQSGCGQLGALTSEGFGADAAQVDAANDTLYTANFDNTISAFDLRRCNASDLAGCATDTPGNVAPVPPGDHSMWVAVDPALHSVYVTYLKDDTVFIVDTDVCNGSHPAGCVTLSPPSIHTGADPEGLSLDPGTQTIYTANQVDNNVSVIDASHCNAQTSGGCRHPAPAVALPGAGGLAVDPAAHTAYVISGPNAVSMINTDTCNAHLPAGCAQTPPTVTVGQGPAAVAVDRATHTVYVANGGTGATGTVTVLDARTCNATNSSGCTTVATLRVPGGNPDDIAVNARTDTVYVATITSSGPDLVSVFNGATCDSTNTSGCGQASATVAVGSSGDAPNNSVLMLAINRETNTIYAANDYNIGMNEPPPFLGNSVYVINGATCDATNTTGCAQTPATVTLAPNPPIGSNPWGIAVDQVTNTIYTANIADGEHPGTVSVINGATCNGHDTSGCSQTPTTAPAGFGAIAIAVDRTTHKIYVANNEDTSVSMIDGAICNGSNASGCDQTPTKAAVGDYPSAIAVDPAVGTAYVTDLEGVSVIPLEH
ncbi:MAG: beta-propeller fold lactonase family protein [Solirubrobacterales bacterium]|nr:beta-propeller fold lactonase family protein [Solirubrobacterales bacterium]